MCPQCLPSIFCLFSPPISNICTSVLVIFKKNTISSRELSLLLIPINLTCTGTHSCLFLYCPNIQCFSAFLRLIHFQLLSYIFLPLHSQALEVLFTPSVYISSSSFHPAQSGGCTYNFIHLLMSAFNFISFTLLLSLNVFNLFSFLDLNASFIICSVY